MLQSMGRIRHDLATEQHERTNTYACTAHVYMYLCVCVYIYICMCVCVCTIYICVCVLSHSVIFDSLQLHRLQPARFLCPWGFSRQEYWSELLCPPPGVLPKPGIKSRSPPLWAYSSLTEPPGKPKNTAVGSLFLLQGIFLTQESNQGLLH